MHSLTEPVITLFNQTLLEIPVSEDYAQTAASLLQEFEDCSFKMVEVVYVDEDGIIAINKKYLQRDYVTDIISFNYDEDEGKENIEGTLYCCAPRIYEQATEMGEKPGTEFFRILIHGLLHLIGYDDQSDEERADMRAKENFYLRKMSFSYDQ